MENNYYGKTQIFPLGAKNVRMFSVATIISTITRVATLNRKIIINGKTEVFPREMKKNVHLLRVATIILTIKRVATLNG